MLAAPDEPLGAALERAGAEDAEYLIAMEEGVPVGLVGRDELERALRRRSAEARDERVIQFPGPGSRGEPSY